MIVISVVLGNASETITLNMVILLEVKLPLKYDRKFAHLKTEFIRCYPQGLPFTSPATGSYQTGAEECSQISDAQRLALVETIH